MVSIIAEIAQAHEGSLGIAHSFIDALATTGVDAVKFQTHIADAESSADEPFRVKFSYADATRYDYWKRMEFSAEQWKGLKDHCGESKLEFIASPFSVAAVDLLERLHVNRYKVGSGEVTNFLMLDKIGKTGKPVILSSGMSSFQELDEAVAFLKEHGNALSLLQCTTAYPTPPEQAGLNVISEMKSRYAVPVGFSDHSGFIFPSLAAVALGATIIEVHCTFDKMMFGPDSKASLTLDQVKELVEGIRFIEKSLLHPIDKNDASAFSSLKQMFGKSLAVNKDLKKGHALAIQDLESKKPANKGIAAKRYGEVLGKRLLRDKMQWDFITEKDFE